MRRSAARYGLCGVALVLCCGTLAGCGGSGSEEVAYDKYVPPASTTTATTTTASDAAYTDTATSTVTDERGDEAKISVSVGGPQPLADVHEEAIEDCNDTIDEEGQSINSAIAIPVEVNVEVTSDVQVPLTVNVGVLAAKEGFVSPLPEDTTRLFASIFGSGPDCGETQGEVIWTAEELPIHTTEHWHTWVVLLNAATPHDPSGDELGDQIVLWLEAVLEDGFQNDGHGIRWTSGAYVSCSGTRYVAADMATLEAEGCKGQ